MLLSFGLKKFKSYLAAELPLSSLTVMIGANASGKSNAIEGLRLVSWLAQGQKLPSIQYSVNRGDQIVRGTARNLPNEGSQIFGFSCTFSNRWWKNWSVEVELRPDGLHITSEAITSPYENVPLYVLDQPSSDRGTDVGVAYNNFARGGKKPHITCIDQMPIFSQLGCVDKRDSQGTLIVIQAGICDGDQLGTRPD
ncbi:AAA family ATPase, partial [Cognatishimia sp. F0-27]|uniref:AAA family ATPase n=1 Tax=Cognatishimia sp. F0-27 TaxID=2816855 RepID=UPI001D0CCF8B